MKRLLFLLLALSSATGQQINGRNARVSWATMTASGTTTAFDVRQLSPSQHSMQAIETGGPSGCSVQLEGSLDNVNWFNLSGAQSCTAASIFFSVVQRPADFVRGNVTTLSGGTSPTITLSYLGSQ